MKQIFSTKIFLKIDKRMIKLSNLYAKQLRDGVPIPTKYMASLQSLFAASSPILDLIVSLVFLK